MQDVPETSRDVDAAAAAPAANDDENSSNNSVEDAPATLSASVAQNNGEGEGERHEPIMTGNTVEDSSSNSNSHNNSLIPETAVASALAASASSPARPQPQTAAGTAASSAQAHASVPASYVVAAAPVPRPPHPHPIAVPRRAVRIAPSGTVPSLPTHASQIVTGVPAPAAVPAAPTAGTVSGNANTQELTKGKRRGIGAEGGQAPVPNEGLSVEERMKQKRMLRNRESAARSRDKKKNKNAKLEASIAQLKETQKLLHSLSNELSVHVRDMKVLLQKHHIDSAP